MSLRLLLGCGGQKIDGFMGVDIEPKVSPDIVDNIITLKTIEPNSVKSIKLVHSFEHLTYKDSIAALETWFRVLKKNGDLSIEFPDLYLCKLMIESDDPKRRQFGINGLFGDIESKNFNLIHKFAWSFLSLQNVMEKIGYVNIMKAELERENQCKLQGYDRDVRLIATKGLKK